VLSARLQQQRRGRSTDLAIALRGAPAVRLTYSTRPRRCTEVPLWEVARPAGMGQQMNSVPRGR
jgi:hypothetical protein